LCVVRLSQHRLKFKSWVGIEKLVAIVEAKKGGLMQE
jgi:hypothetical protein